MKTGMIGLGAMGQSMATHVAEAGYLAGVYNRTTTKAYEFAKTSHVVVYERPEQLAMQVQLLLMCVSADEDVLAIISAIVPHLKPGSIVVDMSTVSSETAIKAEQQLKARQVHYLDAPVSGGVEGAKNGTLSMMVGGSAEALKQARPVLETMTKRIIHIGETGSGQATKAVNQVMCAGINQAVTEALAFAKAQNLPLEPVLAAISGGAAGNWFLDHRGKTMTHFQFTPGFKLALHHKDLKICQAMAQQAGFPIPVTDATVTAYQQLMADGYGEEDISALFRLKAPK